VTPVLPHPTLATEPMLRVDALYVDGVSRPDVVEPHLERIDLTGAPDADWSTLRCDVTLVADEGEMAVLLDSGVEPQPVLVVSCTATNLRLAFPFEVSEDDAEWETVLELSADDLQGKVEVYGELAADLEDRPARRIGTSSSWSLYVDEAAVPPFEGTFKVKWSDFAGESRDPAIPEQAASESFFIDLAGTVPTIHLSNDIEGLRELLSGGTDRPAIETALRDAENRRIATAAWTAAIGAGAAAIKKDEETGEHTLPDQGWMADVLRGSLPVIYDGVPMDEALARLHKELAGPEAVVVQSMIQLAVSKRMDAGKRLRKVLKTQEAEA
jgi:hypothetical protein